MLSNSVETGGNGLRGVAAVAGVCCVNQSELHTPRNTATSNSKLLLFTGCCTTISIFKRAPDLACPEYHAQTHATRSKKPAEQQRLA